ncbi:GTP-binding protein EngB [bacterium]|nr:GTP-binding protein EngB [bacterium]
MEKLTTSQFPLRSSVTSKKRPFQDQKTKNLPRIIFCGQSNVGKSSLIRELTGLRVRVGKIPGSTFKIQEFPLSSFVVVDLPGFGFMKRKSKVEREQNKEDIIHYLETRKNSIALAFIILAGTTFVEMLARWEERNMVTIPVEFGQLFIELDIPFVVIANKIDRLTIPSRQNMLNVVKEAFIEGLPQNTPSPKILRSSAKTGEGVREIRREIINQI